MSLPALCFLLISLPVVPFQLSVMSYNVQNLFDDATDGTELAAYDPTQGDWSSAQFEKKVEAIAQVIRRSSPGGPDLVALQEIENENALDRLTTALPRRFAYRHSIIVPRTKAATHVAFLSKYPIERVHVHRTEQWRGSPTRDVLEIELRYRGKLLHVLNNHWKSKREGVRETEQARVAAADVVRQRIAAICREKPDADIIVLGDLNENVDEYLQTGQMYETALVPDSAAIPDSFARRSLFLASDPARLSVSEQRVTLYETWYEMERTQWGSYVYQDEWQTLDHMLLSRGLFDDKGFYYIRGSFRVMRKPFMVTSPQGYPKRWSPEREGGYSDHLPILITLGFAP